MARGHCGVSGNPEKQKGVLHTHTNIIDEKKKNHNVRNLPALRFTEVE